MPSIVFACQFALLLIAGGQQSERPRLDARFIGNMAFAITDGRVTLMSDFPYESGYSVYMTYPSSEIRSPTAMTLSLITHRHGDHWDAGLFTGTNWKVAGPADVTASAPADRVVPLAQRTTFGPVSIERIETPHARIGHYSYIVTWHGRRMYFSGDTESTKSIAAAKNLDVAFLSPWLYQSARQAGIRIDAKRVVIYHHQSADERVPGCDTGCVVPRQGETIRIE
jgi:L-ascorbate metabolism protein UlaG (beta-lactamase superfamily)